MQDWSTAPKYRCRGDVDNISGHIYNNIQALKTPVLKFDQCSKDFADIWISKNVVPKKLAKKVRRFCQNIAMDDSPVLNDTDNQPRDKVFKQSLETNQIVEAFKNKINDSKQWIWEKYYETFYRATPLSLKAFIGSPIYTLIEYLDKRLSIMQMGGAQFKKLQRHTWVIQKVPDGYDMMKHTDDGDNRRISFVYYLTDTLWDHKEDGGALVMHKEDKMHAINPTFNSLVLWDLKQSPLQVHSVSKVTSKKERIALVGFYGKEI